MSRAAEAKSLELRAATSLARAWQARGRIGEARAVLAEICSWFDAHLDTADLREARVLLAALEVGLEGAALSAPGGPWGAACGEHGADGAAPSRASGPPGWTFPGSFHGLSGLAGPIAAIMRGMKAGTTRRPSRPSPPACAGDTSGPSLPAWKAFVVQFSHETGTRPGIFSGRVEHLNSGRRARFASKQDLLVVLERLLGDIEDPST